MITLENEFLKCEISEVGAELCSVKDKGGYEYMWQAEAPFWHSHAINLFPVCGRLYKQIYTYKGNTYELGNHGFARKDVFEENKVSDTKAVFTLKSSEKTKAIYPFDFMLEMIYVLEGRNLSCTFHVINDGNGELIFACGGHPGFNTDDFENCCIDFGKDVLTERVYSAAALEIGKEREFPTDGGVYKLTYRAFDNDAIFFHEKFDKVTLRCKNGRKVAVSCPEANFWGLWHDNGTEAPFICIEPWYGVPGRDGVIEDFATKQFMYHLPEGKTYDYTYSMNFN